MSRGPDVAQDDLVELSIPVCADLVVLARITAATIASRSGFAVEEIEDLRLAVEELCLSVVRADGEGRLHFLYHRAGDVVEIACRLELEPGGETSPPTTGDPGWDDLSIRILDALVDEHGREASGGAPSAWLRKRRARHAS